jgi:cell division protein FtsI/penicillin-binding protein 2
MGIVAGFSARPGADIQKEHIRNYYDPVLVTGISGFIAGIFILVGTLGYIQLWKGKEYIVRPARVINRNGVPINSYNPRIEILTRLLGAGTIFDRNGLVLATTEPGKITGTLDTLAGAGLQKERLRNLLQKRIRRFYPFGEHMFFWVGDMNTRLFWGQRNGYFAEASHLSELRGFDTKPEKVNYLTTDYRADRFTKPIQKNVTLNVYDYSSLAESLRTGIDTANEKVRAIRQKNRDVRLAVDASLQTEIQKSLDTSIFRDRRISVVVLDAASGDVLASAIHPLPDLQKPEQMQLSDKERQLLLYPVTDRDLGMTYPTAPGSAIKILTALAGFNKIGDDAAAITYRDIARPEIIRDGVKEQEPFNTPVDMRMAIVRSSNVYFIRLANDYALEHEMAKLYLVTGMNVKFRGGYTYAATYSGEEKNSIIRYWDKSVFSINRALYSRKDLYGRKKRYDGELSKIAWGQGLLTSTPAAMARMAAVIANGGVLQPSRYVLDIAGKLQDTVKGITLANSPGSTEKLTAFMIEQSNPGGRQKIKESKVAGKTGTPQRTIHGEERFDGWYVFFAPTPDKRSHTVVCVRIELGELSSNAVLLSDKLATILKSKGYLGSF